MIEGSVPTYSIWISGFVDDLLQLDLHCDEYGVQVGKSRRRGRGWQHEIIGTSSQLSGVAKALEDAANASFELTDKDPGQLRARAFEAALQLRAQIVAVTR